MGIFLGRAVRAAMGVIVWSAIAVGMYAILRAVGSIDGSFDVGREFASVVSALSKVAGAVIAGAGLKALWLLMPPISGQDGSIVLLAGLARFVEIMALVIAFVALVRVIAVIVQGVSYSRP